MKAQTDPALFGIVVYEGVEPIDIGGTVGVLSMARRVLPNVRAITIAERAGPVVLAGGLTMLADVSFADAPACDQFIVTGGPGWRAQTENAAMLDFLKSRAPTQMASVCTGAMIVGASGLLDNRMVTTRRQAVGSESAAPLEELERFAPTARRVAAAVVEDHGLVTGGGVSLAIDATLYLLGRVYGPEARDAVAAVIEYDRAYRANEAALGHLRVVPAAP
jgi:transcriptional regulator GlxA family with amidase domain